MCLEKGTATRDDIDKTLKLGMNHPMGPLQLGKLPSFCSMVMRTVLFSFNPTQPICKLICFGFVISTHHPYHHKVSDLTPVLQSNRLYTTVLAIQSTVLSYYLSEWSTLSGTAARMVKASMNMTLLRSPRSQRASIENPSCQEILSACLLIRNQCKILIHFKRWYSTNQVKPVFS